MDSKAASAISGVLAVLVPVADAAFHWHLQAPVVYGAVAGLLGLAGVFLGHAHLSALDKHHGTILQRVEGVLGSVAEALGELHAKPKDTAAAAPTAGKAP